MACYISSSNNRFYVAAESEHGAVPEIGAAHRIPAIRLRAHQQSEAAERRDKTGTRTFAGTPPGVRRTTSFELESYVTGWSEQAAEPAHAPLIRAAMGAPVQLFAGGTLASGEGTQLVFALPHGLTAGQAVAIGPEIRFTTGIITPTTINVNAPFSTLLTAGTTVRKTATYRLATRLPSVSLFDYWSPGSAVQRILTGATVDRLKITVNGDFHQFSFSGGAVDLLDSTSFTTGQGGLQQFPDEPVLSTFDYPVIPGHLGQAWIGSAPDQFFTLTSAEIQLHNGIDYRDREFGGTRSCGVIGGLRSVTAGFTLFAQDNEQTHALYQAARQRTPVGVMLQLGQNPNQLVGVQLPSVAPGVPNFDDSEPRLQWNFRGCRAQGGSDDELVIGFA